MTRKQQILSYLELNPIPICDDCLSSSTHCYPRQHVNQICRILSEQHQISRYQGFCKICFRNKIVNKVKSEKIISDEAYSRKKDHLIKPVMFPSFPPEKVSSLKISSISFVWKPILKDEISLYQFPNPISSFMKSSYNVPAIYRWIVQTPDNKVLYYIGETEQLCPRRITHYLKPGPSQKTNERLNELFLEHIKMGCQIHMDYLDFNTFSLNSITVSQNSLKNKNVRRMIENLIIFQFQEQGIFLLNR